MSRPLTLRQIRTVESCRDNTNWTSEDVAKHYGIDIAEVRRIYAMKGKAA